MKNKGIKIAVTGGIGSGKTALCGYIKKKGYSVIDADSLGKEILRNDKNVKEKIIRHFGPKTFNGDEPDTRFIASLVFSDETNLEKINSIIHPPVMKRITEMMNSVLKSQNLVFAESAIVFESELEEYFDYVILVVAEQETRIQRILKKNQLKREDIEQRILNQMTDDDKKELADFTLQNNGSEADLFSKAEFLLNLLESMAKK